MFGNEGKDGSVSVLVPASVRGRVCGEDVWGDPALASTHSSFFYLSLGRRTAEVHRPSPHHLSLPIEPGMDEER